MSGNSVISQPDMTINITPAQTDVSNTPQRVLMVGQMKTVGTLAQSGDLNEQIGNDKSDWAALFGEGSMIYNMVAAFKTINQVTRLDVIALEDDGAGVPATGTIAFSGTATDDGEYTVTVGGPNHVLTVAVASGDTATDVGDTLVAAVNADATIPVTAANVTGTVTFTAVNDGTEGNDITLGVSGNADGISVVLTGMSGGSTNPSLTGLFDVVGDIRYQTVVWPYSYGLTDLTTFLDSRFNVNNSVLDGVGVTTATDTYANLVSAGNAENSQNLSILGFPQITFLGLDAGVFTSIQGSAMFEQGVLVSSQFAAIRSLRLTSGANISQYVITTGGASDGFGGPAIASLPYFNTLFTNLPLIKTGYGWDNTEIEGLISAGVSTLGNNTAGNAVIAGEIVTTYKTDSAGNTDTSYKYLNYVDTISNAREYFFNNLKARFAQSRLTEGDLIGGRSMANENAIRAFSMGLFGDLSGAEYVLLQAGEDARVYFNDNLAITLDLATGSVTWNCKAPIVTQFRTLTGSIQISFSVEG